MRILAPLLVSALLAAPLVAPSVLAQSQSAAQSAGGEAADAAKTPQASSISPGQPPKPFQKPGSYPTNTITNRPYVGPQGGTDGLRATVGALQRTLTELQQLQLQVKQAHWNVSGAGFWQIHAMLQEHYEGLSKYADEVAERLLAVGASADGRAHTIVATSKVPEIPGGFLDGAAEMAWFTDVYKMVGDEVRQAVRDAEEPDPTSSNLLQEVENAIDKYQWQTRAFLQATPTNPNTGAETFNAGKPVDLPSRTPPDLPAAAGQ